MKAAAAYDEGFYDDLVVPFLDVEEDNNIRRDTTFEKLQKLKPVFDRSEEGTMTAGNSTPLTDGAAAVLLASEDWARKKNLPILAYLTFAKVAAVDFINTEGLLMAPAYAVSDMLNSRSICSTDHCHAQGLAGRELLPRKARAQRTDGADRPVEAQRQGRQHRRRSSICGNRGADRRHAGETAQREWLRARPDLDLYCRRDGRLSDSGSRVRPFRVAPGPAR
jgi:hypothetical protein